MGEVRVLRQYQQSSSANGSRDQYLPKGGLLSGRLLLSALLLAAALSRKDLFCLEMALPERCLEKLSELPPIFFANMLPRLPLAFQVQSDSGWQLGRPRLRVSTGGSLVDKEPQEGHYKPQATDSERTKVGKRGRRKV